MNSMFDDMMSGLDEVDAFLAGKTAGYKVNLQAVIAKNPIAVIAALHPQHRRVNSK
jgi:hypothetical protein